MILKCRNMKKQEWSKYKVNESFGCCKPLDKIYHVCHTRNAVNIVSEGKIKADLVYDESKLNKDRTLVCWLSPNVWDGAGGSRYGNVGFEFDWKDICDDMNYYWVEVIDYSPKALRILVTDQDYDGKLDSYDPESKNGPWWYNRKEDQHYWNGIYCLEIMVERDLSMSEIIGVDFVSHHQHRCNLRSPCNEKGNTWLIGGSLFIAGIVRQNIKHRLPKFYKTNDDEIELDYKFEQSCQIIKRYLDDINKFFGKINSRHKKAAKKIMSLWENGVDGIWWHGSTFTIGLFRRRRWKPKGQSCANRPFPAKSFLKIILFQETNRALDSKRRY